MTILPWLFVLASCGPAGGAAVPESPPDAPLRQGFAIGALAAPALEEEEEEGEGGRGGEVWEV